MNPNEVQFSGEEFQYDARAFQSSSSGFIARVIRCSHGIIKNEKQARYVLMLLSLLLIIISVFVFLKASPRIESSVPSPDFNSLET